MWVFIPLVCVAADKGSQYQEGISVELLKLSVKCHFEGDSKMIVDRDYLFSPEEIDEMIKERNEMNTPEDFFEFLNTVSRDSRALEITSIFGIDDGHVPAYISDLMGIEYTGEQGDELNKIIGISKIVHERWNGLHVKQTEIEEGIYSTMVEVPNSFIIPGERFQECYYWDTYWIILGLLRSELYRTVVGMIENFIYVIETYKSIPNGFRTYYLGRTQPPYFTMMLLELHNHKDKMLESCPNIEDVLSRGLEAAKEEYKFFMENRIVEVEKDGIKYTLNVYRANGNTPRPESYKEDYKIMIREGSRETVCNELRSGAESGWDFSTRWLVGNNLETIRVTTVIPADLNAILYANELIIYSLSKDKDRNTWKEKSEIRKKAINAILWNDGEGCWNDYDIELKKHTSTGFYVSNLVPMCYGIPPPTGSIYDVLRKYESSIFGFEGGIPASGEEYSSSNQQWDFPNVWPPLVHIVASFLERIGEEKMALHVARPLVRAVIKTAMANVGGPIFEKYSCEEIGILGKKGEYFTQKGFGWTNGVVADFIAVHGPSLVTKLSHKKSKAEVSSLLSERTVSPPSFTPENCLNLPKQDDTQ
jgi:alpha,alpha-trehalase